MGPKNLKRKVYTPCTRARVRVARPPQPVTDPAAGVERPTPEGRIRGGRECERFSAGPVKAPSSCPKGKGGFKSASSTLSEQSGLRTARTGGGVGGVGLQD